MIDYLLIIPLLASFFLTLILIPYWVRKAKQIDLMWDDMNKIRSEKVAGSAGIVVIMSFILGLLLFVAYRVFILRSNEHLIEIFVSLSIILMLGMVGFIDDLLGWRKGGLSKKSRIIMVAFAAVPIMAINAGKSLISLPLLGQVDLGIVYPLILIPLGIVGASTTFNFLAGFNGLEAGQGIILLSAMSLVAYITHNPWLTIIGLSMIASLVAFLMFNFNPAKVFPGDVLTYPIGGLIAILAIFGNFERIAVFFFIPVILEVILKSRGKFVKQSFGKPNLDGSISLKYDKIYGLTHLSIWILNKLRIKPTENKVVYLIWSFQILVILIGFLIFGSSI